MWFTVFPIRFRVTIYVLRMWNVLVFNFQFAWPLNGCDDGSLDDNDDDFRAPVCSVVHLVPNETYYDFAQCTCIAALRLICDSHVYAHGIRFVFRSPFFGSFYSGTFFLLLSIVLRNIYSHSSFVFMLSRFSRPPHVSCSHWPKHAINCTCLAE